MSERVPCPREVWAAAVDGRRMSITVKPDVRAARSGSSPVQFSGDIIGRRKVGDAWTTYVTVRFVPDGELAPVELEAGKDREGWGPFRAFHWKQPQRPTGPEDHRYVYVGEVVELDIPGVTWDGAMAREDREVTA